MMLTVLQAAGDASRAVALDSRDASLRIVYMVGAMIVLVLLLGLIVLHLRRTMLAGEKPEVAGGSVFEELRLMHRRGEITHEEFEVMRRRAAQKLGGVGPSIKPLSSGGGAGVEPIISANPSATPRAADKPSAERGLRAKPGFDLTGEPLPRREDRAD